MSDILGRRGVVTATVLILAWSAAYGGEATYESALAALHAGNYEQAAVQFEEVVGQHPDWAPGLKTLGQCYYMLGRPDDGRKRIELARELDPDIDLFQAYYAAGQTLYQKREFALAIAPLARAYEHAGPEQRSSIAPSLGHANLKTERFEDARRVLEAESNLDSISRRHLALACQRTGDYDCALSTLRTIRDSDKARKDLARWSHYWTLEASNGSRRAASLEQAAADTRGWLDASPEDDEALRLHAEVLLAARRFDDLIALAASRARRNENDCAARLILAQTHNALRDSAEAESWARQEVECSPNSVDGRLELVAALMRQLRGDFSTTDAVEADLRMALDATETVDLALRLDPDNERAKGLAVDLRTATSRLREVAADLARNDREHETEIIRVRREELLARCRNILWKIRDETRELSDDDRTFYDENDCKQSAAP